MPRFTIRNKLITNDPVAGATVEIDFPATGPTLISGTTNRWGHVTLNTSSLSDGRHDVRVTPAHTSADPVGPATASNPVPPSRVFRTYTFSITLLRGAVTAVTAPAGNTYGTARLLAGGNVQADVQPIWMASPNHRSRGTTNVSLVIVHHTGGAVITSAINTFLSARTSAHYVIDKDGQIVKMVQDGQRANHAGTAHWAGSTNINSMSIGIEIVHRTAGGAYPAAQYTALLGLLGRIRASYPGIPTRNIIGHSDVGTNAAGRLGRKSTDPGLHFDWTRLESAGLGMVRAYGPYPPSLYGGLFQQVANGAFRRGDNDARNRFGGATRTTVTGNPVRQIQQDLFDIGYSVGTPDGDFGERTHYAVEMFQEHFFAGGNGHKAPDGRVDYQTASLIQSVMPP